MADVFFQVLLTRFTLTKTDEGLLLDVALADDLPSITDPSGKRALFDAVSREAREELKRELARFRQDEHLRSQSFDCRDCPLRYANGGVLPVVRLGLEDYFCLSYRDVEPIGWNLANGGSKHREELLQPERLLRREFAEELIILDEPTGLIYTPGSDSDRPLPRRRSGALRAWIKRLEARRPGSLRCVPAPVAWIHGPDQVRVSMGSRCEWSGGYFLSITPDDQSIEVDRAAVLSFFGDVTLLDGETCRGLLLNRPVGLFRVRQFDQARLAGTTFLPDLVFFDATRYPPERLEEIIQPSRLLAMEDVFRQNDRRQGADAKYDLCPVTRSVIARYLAQRQSPGAAEARLRSD